MLHVQVRGNEGIVHSPAKVNLFLEVLRRREDGFHEIETLISPIAIFDTLYFTANSQGNLRLTCNWASGHMARNRSPLTSLGWGELPASRNNLAWRAIELFRQRAGVTLGASIHITKRVPAEAGLGGASADAAAALVAANRMWNVNFDTETLSAIGAELGSDVPVLIDSQVAICRGRGEQLEPITPANRLDLVVVKPPVGLSTAHVYQRCRPPQQPRDSSPLVKAWQAGNIAGVAGELHNRLQEPSLELAPEVGHLKDIFNSLGVVGHQMTGSGSSYFGICQSAKHARQVANRLQGMDIGEVMMTRTISH